METKTKCPECWEPAGASDDCGTCVMYNLALKNVAVMERMANALEQMSEMLAKYWGRPV